MRILFIGLTGFLLVFSSCKRCYVCTKQNTITVNGIDSVQNLQFDACNHGKEGNGELNGIAIKQYEANGYKCSTK